MLNAWTSVSTSFSASTALLCLGLALSACHQQSSQADTSALAASNAATVAASGAMSADVAASAAASAYHVVALTDQHVELSAVAQLGRSMFFDQSLSGSGKLACASCHNPNLAYGPSGAFAVQLGGTEMQAQGARAVPSLRYLDHNPNFTIGPNSAVPDSDAAAAPPPVASPDTKVAGVAKSATPSAAAAANASVVPQGGLDWDGRADSLQDQASGPFLDPHEMANRDANELLHKLQHSAYADSFVRLFGARVFDNPQLALSEALFALARFQIEDPSFHPYDSKYDYYLAGRETLTAQEMRGLKLFEDPAKGNCSSCHIDKPSRDGVFLPAFTDYQFESLAAPRNYAITANRNPHYFDMGLCGPTRIDYAHTASYCGLFKTPTLRNVATRQVFFHNGFFHSLDDVLHFYVERETKPGNWYPRGADGRVIKYDDLPPRYRKNVDVADAPFDRKLGEAPALNADEIADIIAFLKTLNDGYQPTSKVASAASR